MPPLLPSLFLDRLTEQFGLRLHQEIIQGFSQERLPVLRVNTLKSTPRLIMDVLRSKAIPFERVSFLENALVIKKHKEKDLEDLDIYKEGHIYFQGLSSQIPPLFLAPEKSEKVLDMTAAPGSKTSQMASMMENTGEIIANELSEIRFQKLEYTLQKQGVFNTRTKNSDACFLGNEFPEYFDAILLDAPCSAEGRIFVKNPRSYKFWSEKNIKECAKLQKRLIKSAYKALKKGGRMVYSTCTLAPEENEEVIDYALKTFPDLKVKPLSLEWAHLLPILSTFGENTYHQSIKGALKAKPSLISEGFFITLLVKE